jgi:hypothetical protein
MVVGSYRERVVARAKSDHRPSNFGLHAVNTLHNEVTNTVRRISGSSHGPMAVEKASEQATERADKECHMSLPPWSYQALRDAVTGLAAVCTRGLHVNVETYQLGSTTRIIVRARCKAGATRPVTVRGCRAERYETVFDSCAGPQPVRDHVINFLPKGPVTVRSGEAEARWEAQILTEHLLRSAREGDAAATAREGGTELLELKKRYEQERYEQAARRAPASNIFVRLLQSVERPDAVRVRAVLDTINDGVITTRAVLIPSSPPLAERLGLPFC